MKKRRKKIPGSAKEWLIHAESDLAMAKLAAGDQDILASQICFHAQQAAEKAIKGVLRRRKIEFPLTHDLDVLLDLLEKSRLSVPEDVQQAGQLTPYAVEARYPGSAWSAEDDIQTSIRLAEAIIDWASTLIA